MNQNSLELVDRNGVVYKTVEKMAANLAALNAKFKIVLADGTAAALIKAWSMKKPASLKCCAFFHQTEARTWLT